MPDLKINVAFIGTGLMGLPMVKNLSKGDYSISAFNRTLSKMDELKSIKNINICSSLDEALKDATVIITSLPDDSAVEKIINEIPLPTPLAVICSPSHMIRIVPVTNVTVVTNLKYIPGSRTIPCEFSKLTETPYPCTKASNTVPYLVYWVIFFLPYSP